MVTAVVIPILIIYFYWITRKEAGKQKERWENLCKFPLESRVEGKVIQLNTERKHFYHQLYTLDTTIRIQGSDKTITVVHKQPFMSSTQSPSISLGEHIIVNGRWENDLFLVGEIITKNKEGQPK